MALYHPISGELVDIRPLGDKLVDTPSTALVRTDDFEVMRMILPAGKSVPQHHVPGEMTIQCLEGTVELQAHDKTVAMRAGDLVFLAGDIPHALYALENSAILVTMVRKPTDNTV
ncbi:MAG TPA: cupin domain-containing protein [Noviherbaspirillum sp.]|nr:cupin domain-containing protein [Noviherbaspirillum sp.]